MHVNTPCVDVLSGLKDESCLGDVHRYCDARFWFHEKLTKRGFRINAVENVEKAMKQVVHALSMRAKGRSARCTREAWAATQRSGSKGCGHNYSKGISQQSVSFIAVLLLLL
jgi:hypothetical protein